MSVVQYIIVRKDLDEGVLATQVAHASVAPVTNQLRPDMERTIEDALDDATKTWVDGPFTKIVLEVPDKDSLNKVEEILAANGIEYDVMRESRLNGEPTSIGLKPYEKSDVAGCLNGLKLLGSKKRDEVKLKVDGKEEDAAQIAKEMNEDGEVPEIVGDVD